MSKRLGITVPELTEQLRAIGTGCLDVAVRRKSILFLISADQQVTRVQQVSIGAEGHLAYGLVFEPRTSDFLTNPDQFLVNIKARL